MRTKMDTKLTLINTNLRRYTFQSPKIRKMGLKKEVRERY